MSDLGKDSKELVEFMSLFARLKNWCDDSPEDLVDFAESDASVSEVCEKLAIAAYCLKLNERRSRELFSAPVDRRFILEWREYELRYEPAVNEIWLSSIFPEFGSNKTPKIPDSDIIWDNAESEATEQAFGIEQAIDFAEFNADQEHRWTDQPEFAEGIKEGIAAWASLKAETGFDLRGVFRRRALIPFVLIPKKVSDKYGSKEKLSLLKYLEQAHDAFVFGVSYAAIALMRSIMEAVLRDHYHVKGTNLNELINNARRMLPPAANADSLHRLKNMANAILHADNARNGDLPKFDKSRLKDDAQIEKEIVSLLFVLRALIEGVK